MVMLLLRVRCMICVKRMRMKEVMRNEQETVNQIHDYIPYHSHSQPTNADQADQYLPIP